MAGGVPFAVNSAGQIAGACAGVNRAAPWEDSEAAALPLLPGDVMSKALGINEAGQIVGLSEREDGVSRRRGPSGAITGR